MTYYKNDGREREGERMVTWARLEITRQMINDVNTLCYNNVPHLFCKWNDYETKCECEWCSRGDAHALTHTHNTKSTSETIGREEGDEGMVAFARGTKKLCKFAFLYITRRQYILYDFGWLSHLSCFAGEGKRRKRRKRREKKNLSILIRFWMWYPKCCVLSHSVHVSWNNREFKQH